MAPPNQPRGDMISRPNDHSSEGVKEEKIQLQRPSSSLPDNSIAAAPSLREYKTDNTYHIESCVVNGNLEGNSIMSKLKEDFSEMCCKLNVSETLKKKAQVRWEELWLSDPRFFDDKRITWFTCALYIAHIESRSPLGSPPQFTITDLLVNTNVHFKDFFSHMQSIREIQNLSNEVRNHLQQLGKHYCISNAMFYKFERIFEDVYKQSQNISSDQVIQSKKKLCWVFFLVCKASYRNANTEIFFCIQMLVWCIHYIGQHTSSDMLNPPYSNDRSAIISTHFRTPNELKPAQEAVEQVLKNVLVTKNAYLDVDRLVALYLETYKREGNINELLFLDHNPIFSPLPSGGREKPTSHREDNSNSPSHRIVPPLTPVSTAVTKVEQLTILLKDQSERPDDVLKEFFLKCNPNPLAAITTRIQNCESSFVEHFLKFSGYQPAIHQLAQQRYQLIVKLYFRILKSFLISEQRRLGKTTFTSLLHFESLHRALLACSAEVVLFTYGVSSTLATQNMRTGSSEFDFPWVLEVFNLKAYELFLVLESFLRSENKLSEDVRKHIQKVENEILERFAWKEDSPVFEVASGYLEEILEPPTSENGNNDTLSTPTKNNNNNAGSTIHPGTPGSGNNNHGLPNSNTTPNTNNSTSQANTSSSPSQAPTESPAFSSVPDTPRSGRPLKHFFSKVFHLAHQRLSVLCLSLKVNNELKLKVWTCLRYCIISQRELLRRRHLDQIMMCCLFGICRVVRQDIKFKDIMTVYKDLPHSQPESSHVFKVILLQNGDTDSIVGFYNKVFLPIMKTYLLQFNPTRPSAPPLSPIPKYGVTSSPVCSVAGKKNLHVSSVKSPIYKSQCQLTPRTHQLYCFGEGIGSAEKLRNINDIIARSRPSSCQKRLYFDNLDNGVRNVAKRLKFDGPDGSSSQSESTFKSPMSPALSAPRGGTTPGKETPEKKESPSIMPRHVITPNIKRTQRHLRFDDNQGSSENEASGSSVASAAAVGQSSTIIENSLNNRKENKIDK